MAACPPLPIPLGRTRGLARSPPPPRRLLATPRGSSATAPRAPSLAATPRRTTGARSSSLASASGRAGWRSSSASRQSPRSATGLIAPPLVQKREDTWGTLGPPQVLGVGDGGVEELAQRVDSATVSWALLRCQVGGGTFARIKSVVVHCNGGGTPVMQRGMLNARGPAVVELLGDVHVTAEVQFATELTVEYLCERLLPLFAFDDLDYSVPALRSEYEQSVARAQEERRRLEEAARRRLEEQAEQQEAPRPEPRSRPEAALREVADDRGAFNWALFDPDRLELHSAGHGGLEEMKASLDSSRVLFGVLRLSFGYGDASRSHADVTKHVFVHWVGPGVGAVRRGRWNARLQDASKLVASYATVAFKREAHRLQDLDLREVISEVRRLTVVDRRAASGGVAAAHICVEEYIKALDEEQRRRNAARQGRRTRGSVGASPDAPEPAAAAIQPPALPDLLAAVEDVSAPWGQWNWVLIGWPRAAAAEAFAPAAMRSLALVASPSRALARRAPPRCT